MIVLITGASSGFGVAIARRFAQSGHRIIAIGRRAERLTALAAELGDALALTLPLDVRDRAAVERAIAGLPPELAAIDLLVNNAGLARGLEPAQHADLDDWEEMVDTNIKGLMTMTHAVLPGQRRFDGGPLALPGRERLRRHEGVRPSVLIEPAGRSAGDQGAGHRRPSGHDRWNGVLVDPLSR
jgi:NADP-dependent 3-hydroxy acid dehydrogenase YdfG